MVQPQIDFEAKTDRELLLLTAQIVNVIVQEKLPAIEVKLDELNGTVREHSIELAKVETKYEGNTNHWRDKKVIGGVSGAIGLLVAAFYALGNALGWW